jgi:hypothetical protein
MISLGICTESSLNYLFIRLCAPVLRLLTCITNCVHVLIDRCTRAGRRRTGTACGALNSVDRHLRLPTIIIDRGLFRKHECRVDLLHRLLEESTAHSDPEDDHLWGEYLQVMGKKGDTRFSQVHPTTHYSQT